MSATSIYSTEVSPPLNRFKHLHSLFLFSFASPKPLNCPLEHTPRVDPELHTSFQVAIIREQVSRNARADSFSVYLISP